MKNTWDFKPLMLLLSAISSVFFVFESPIASQSVVEVLTGAGCCFEMCMAKLRALSMGPSPGGCGTFR